MEYSYPMKGTCANLVQFELDGDQKLHKVRFHGGCNGNLKAIGRLVEGRDAGEVKDILAGNLCGNRNTSCADQLSLALQQALGA